MSQAESASITFASTENAAVIAANNNRARASIGREIEELLRIKREADTAATRLIDLLDLHELDPDLEPYLGSGHGGGDDREWEDEGEPSLGWTLTINQASGNR